MISMNFRCLNILSSKGNVPFWGEMLSRVIWGSGCGGSEQRSARQNLHGGRPLTGPLPAGPLLGAKSSAAPLAELGGKWPPRAVTSNTALAVPGSKAQTRGQLWIEAPKISR